MRGKMVLTTFGMHALAATAAAVLLAPSLAHAVLDPAAKCQATKLKLVAKYASCRLIADAKAVKAGTSPDYTACETKIADGWAKVEAAYPQDCPTLGDLGEVDDEIVQCLPTSLYTLRVFVDPVDPVASMEYFVNYAESYGEIEGSGTDVSCAPQVPGSLNAFDDDDAGKEMRAGFIDLTNLTTPVEIVRCTFIHHGIEDARESQFSLGVEIAYDEDGVEVDVPDLDVILEKGPY